MIDPWNLYLSVLSLLIVGGALLIFLKVTKEQLLDGFKASITARDRLDLNISTTLVELATTSMKMFGKEGEKMLQKARGSYAPYRIQNRTGSPLLLWSDDESHAVKIDHSRTIDWRFDDWKTMREVSVRVIKLNEFDATVFSMLQRMSNTVFACK